MKRNEVTVTKRINMLQSKTATMKTAFIIIMTLCAAIASAQGVDTETLKSGPWRATDVEYINKNGGFLRTTYTDSLCITDISLYEGSDTLHVESYYYLTDSRPKAFDMAMVGKPARGRYIVISEVLEAIEGKFVVKWDDKTVCSFEKK